MLFYLFQLNLTGHSDVSLQIKMKEWDLIGTDYTRNVYNYMIDMIFINLTYTIKLLRRSTYSIYSYVAPVAILSLLGAVIFLMSPGNQQKLALGKYCLLVIYFLGIHCSIFLNVKGKLAHNSNDDSFLRK